MKSDNHAMPAKNDLKVDNKAIYDEHWDEWADMKKYGPKSRWLRSLMKRCLNRAQSPITSIADVGCGVGTNTAFLAEVLQCPAVGMDISITGVENARRLYRGRGDLTFGLMEEMPLEENQYDMVTCFDVLEHEENWEELLLRIVRASRKYVMVSSVTGRMRPFEVNIGHVLNFKLGQIEAFLAQYGVMPVEVCNAGFPFYSPIYRNICNIMDPAESEFSMGKYGMKQKAVANMIYFLFRYLSAQKHKGDVICAFFDVTGKTV